MKILPVINSHFLIKPLSAPTFPAQTMPEGKELLLPAGYYKPVSFGVMVNPEFENELKSLHDVRCPVCSKKMLSYEDLQYIGIEISRVETAEDFLRVLKNHQENIPAFAERLLRKADELLQKMPEIEPTGFANILSGEASKKIDFALRDGIALINEKQNQKIFSDSDEVLADECKMRLAELTQQRDKRRVVTDVKKILGETVAVMENPEKWEIYDSIKKEIIKRSNYKSLFRYGAFDSGKRLKIILENLFSNSEINLRKVQEKLPFDKEKNFNVIMLCKGCNFDKQAFLRALYNGNEQTDENFKAYLADITREIVKGNISTNKMYPIELNGLLKKLSNGRLVPFEDEKLKFDIKMKNFRDFHEEIDFKPVKISCIPCACCGISTITHEEKCALMEKIKNAPDLKSILSIMNGVSGFIHEKYRPLLEIAENGVDENLTEREILFRMRLYEQQNLNIALEKAAEKLEKVAELRKLPPSYSAHIEEFRELIKTKYYDYDYLKEFPYEEYKNDVKNIVRKLGQYDEKRIRSMVKEPVRAASSEQLLLFPLGSTTYKVGSALKCVMQDILKRSTATIDHLQPKNKGGSNEIENLAVLCDDCNKRKSDYEFPIWLKINPRMKHNYKKYFNKIDELVARGELKGYESYLAKQKKYIKDLTGWLVNAQVKSDYAFKSDSTSRL